MGQRLWRIVLIGCGSLCVALGVLGIFLPLLPTTVFLLLAAACYAKSSARFYRGLITNRWLGPYIRNYHENRGMTKRQKALALSVLWIGIGTTMAWGVTGWWIRAVLAALAIGVTVHVARLKRVRPEIAAEPMTDVAAGL